MSWYVVDLICIYLRNRVGTAKCSYARTSISPVFKLCIPFNLRIQHTACHGNWKASVVASTQVGSRAAVAVTCLP